MDTKDIYNPTFVSNLFDKMSKTYGVVNYISSFGFSEFWRIRCVNKIAWNSQSESVVTYDLMSGMGECWNLISKKSGTEIIGVDISSEMVEKSLIRNNTISNKLMVLKKNILVNDIDSGNADYIISSFGLKTFSNDQLSYLARETHRILKEGGKFSFVEISVPSNKLLKIIYLFYLEKIIPLVGKYFANDDYSYKYLALYTKKFKNSKHFFIELKTAGLQVEYSEFFFGCATGVSGYKA